MNSSRTVLCVVYVVYLAGCAGEQAATTPALSVEKPAAAVEKRSGQEEPVVEDLARAYDSLTLITKEPVLVDPQLASLCVGISPRAVDEARQRGGPHAHTSAKIYMNEIAAEAFRERLTAYPVGSAIVKEKLGLEYDLVGENGERLRNAGRTANGVGGMIKRAAGYDPDHGDWEYFYFEDPTEVERGKITSCVECHRDASATDYVFGGWATPQ